MLNYKRINASLLTALKVFCAFSLLSLVFGSSVYAFSLSVYSKSDVFWWVGVTVTCAGIVAGTVYALVQLGELIKREGAKLDR